MQGSSYERREREETEGEKSQGVLKGREPFSWSEVREKGREQEREWHVWFAQYAVVRGSPGLYRERLLPFLEYIWKRVFYLSKNKGPSRSHGAAVQQ